MTRVAVRPDGTRRPETLLQYDYDSYQWQFPAAPAEASDSERDAGTPADALAAWSSPIARTLT